MANLMGKNRLKKIFWNYISSKPELYKTFQKEYREYGDKSCFFYSKNARRGGNEWLKVALAGCNCAIYAWGETAKSVTITEWEFDEDDKRKEKERVVTYYNKNFNPLPANTWISGNADKGTKGCHPFTDAKTTPDGLSVDMFVCFNVSKSKKART